MTKTKTKHQNKRKADHKQSDSNSATGCAFLRLSSILLEIIYADNEGGNYGAKGGDAQGNDKDLSVEKPSMKKYIIREVSDDANIERSFTRPTKKRHKTIGNHLII